MPRTPKQEADRKKAIVAAGIVEGKTPAAIAAEADTSVRHVQRLAKQPGMQFLIAELFKPHAAELARHVKRAVTSVGTALEATTGRGNANHEIRLRAVGRLRDLLELAQGEIQPVDPNKREALTWEQLYDAFRELEARKGSVQ